MDEKKIIEVAVPFPSSVDNEKSKKKEEVFKWVPCQLPVKPFKKTSSKSRFQMPLLTVHGVLMWALLAAGCVAVTVGIVAAMVLASISLPCSQSPSWWMTQCPTLTPAQSVEVESLGGGFLLFNVPLAAAATVGLILPRRRAARATIRWTLALVALVSAAAAHYMQSRSVLVFIAANPEDIWFRVLGGGGAIVFVAGDLLSILSLLIGGTE